MKLGAELWGQVRSWSIPLDRVDFLSVTRFRDDSRPSSPRSDGPRQAVLLGKIYSPSPPGGILHEGVTEEEEEQRQRFNADFHSLVWFTYRKNFQSIGGTKYCSDTGWGCMLRSGQMLLFQALLRHFLGDRWSLLENTAVPETFRTYRMMLSWFQDLDGPHAPYSIHHMAELGLRYNIPVGQHHGPSSTAHVIATLVAQHSPDGLQCFVARDSTLYLQDVRRLLKDGQRGLLLLMPLRLGVTLNDRYLPALNAFLTFPQCLGFAGGKAGSSVAAKLGTSLKISKLRSLQSMYFMGADSDGGFYYLDPHHTQASLQSVDIRHCSQAQLASYHCEKPLRMSQMSIDPSLLLGFYLRNLEDFEDLCQRCSSIKTLPFALINSERPTYNLDGIAVDAEDSEDEEAEAQSACMDIAVYNAEEERTRSRQMHQIIPIQLREMAMYQTKDGFVRGLLVLTHSRIYFEPLQQEPLVRAKGKRIYRWSIDIKNLKRCQIVTETEEMLDDEQFVLITRKVETEVEGEGFKGPSFASVMKHGLFARQSLMTEENVRKVLIQELKASVQSIQEKFASEPLPPANLASPETEAVNQAIRLLIERIELVLRHGIRVTIGLFGRRTAFLWPILQQVLPSSTIALLRDHCGPSPDDAFLIPCWIRYALTTHTLLETCQNLHQRALHLGYTTDSLIANPDAFAITSTLLAGLDHVPFNLPIVDIPLAADEEDNYQLPDGLDLNLLVESAHYYTSPVAESLSDPSSPRAANAMLRLESAASGQSYWLQTADLQRVYDKLVAVMSEAQSKTVASPTNSTASS